MRKKSGMARFVDLSVAICLWISIILSGCTQETPGQETPDKEASNDTDGSGTETGPARGGTLKIIVADSFTNLGYPAEQRVTSNLYIVQPALETLGRYDTTGKMKPWLAESWQTDPKAKTITFQLKKGIKFHDDTDFNAEAVKWNIEEYQKAKRPEVNGIQSMDIIDADTLRLNLVEWDNGLLESLCYFVNMVSPAAVSKNGKEWAIKNPVGTGPFKLASWERDVSVKFKKNENYWQKGKPYLDAIEYALIADKNTAANVFKTGGADVIMQSEIDVFQELEKSGKYTTLTNDKIPGALGVGLMFDSGNPNSPFADVKVRQAVMYAVDREAIQKSVYRGYAVITGQWDTSLSWSYNPNVQGYPYDPEKAKQLLKEAGYPAGFKTKITTDPVRANLMTAIQSYLAKVGIDAQVVTVDFARWGALAADKWDGMILFFRALTPNTIVQMNRLFSTNGALYAKNIIHPDKVEKLLAEARTATDVEASKKAVHELQKAVFKENAIGFPAFSLIHGLAVDPKVQNLGMYKTNAFDWNPEDVWIKK
jgi:peptide/nickel transport system substrate-binding protein